MGMKSFETVTYTDIALGRVFRSRLFALGGVPEVQDSIVSLSPGVERGTPVVVIGQKSGDGRTEQGAQLMAVRPDDARSFARELLAAADEADRQAKS